MMIMADGSISTIFLKKYLSKMEFTCVSFMNIYKVFGSRIMKGEMAPVNETKIRPHLS
jgi:hypothetical protein